MSPSDTRTASLTELAARVEHQVDALLSTSDCLVVSPDALRSLVSAAARLHAHASEAGTAAAPLRPDVSPTEAVDLACGLLRARDLNPFDLALWFSRPA